MTGITSNKKLIAKYNRLMQEALGLHPPFYKNLTPEQGKFDIKDRIRRLTALIHSDRDAQLGGMPEEKRRKIVDALERIAPVPLDDLYVAALFSKQEGMTLEEERLPEKKQLDEYQLIKFALGQHAHNLTRHTSERYVLLANPHLLYASQRAIDKGELFTNPWFLDVIKQRNTKIEEEEKAKLEERIKDIENKKATKEQRKFSYTEREKYLEEISALFPEPSGLKQKENDLADLFKKLDHEEKVYEFYKEHTSTVRKIIGSKNNILQKKSNEELIEEAKKILNKKFSAIRKRLNDYGHGTIVKDYENASKENSKEKLEEAKKELLKRNPEFAQVYIDLDRIILTIKDDKEGNISKFLEVSGKILETNREKTRGYKQKITSLKNDSGNLSKELMGIRNPYIKNVRSCLLKELNRVRKEILKSDHDTSKQFLDYESRTLLANKKSLNILSGLISKKPKENPYMRSKRREMSRVSLDSMIPELREHYSDILQLLMAVQRDSEYLPSRLRYNLGNGYASFNVTGKINLLKSKKQTKKSGTEKDIGVLSNRLETIKENSTALAEHNDKVFYSKDTSIVKLLEILEDEYKKNNMLEYFESRSTKDDMEPNVLVRVDPTGYISYFKMDSVEPVLPRPSDFKATNRRILGFVDRNNYNVYLQSVKNEAKALTGNQAAVRDEIVPETMLVRSGILSSISSEPHPRYDMLSIEEKDGVFYYRFEGKTMTQMYDDLKNPKLLEEKILHT